MGKIKDDVNNLKRKIKNISLEGILDSSLGITNITIISTPFIVSGVSLCSAPILKGYYDSSGVEIKPDFLNYALLLPPILLGAGIGSLLGIDEEEDYTLTDKKQILKNTSLGAIIGGFYGGSIGTIVCGVSYGIGYGAGYLMR